MSKVLGVIGGMGPAATVDFLDRLVRATPAQRDQDHIRVLVDSNPQIPNRNEALAGTGPSPGPMLAEMAAGLERAGAEVLVMACNTAHAFEADIREAVTVPFIGMIDATADHLAQVMDGRGYRVGVLAVDGCVRAGLYQQALARRGLEAVMPTDADQARLMDAVYRIKAGDLASARADIVAIARSLDGADAVVSACTELPLVLKAADLEVKLVDSTDVLVARALDACLASERDPT